MPLSIAGTSQLGAHHGSTYGYVSDIVLGGNNYIELADGRENPDRLDLYSEAYVPLMGTDGIHGVIEVYVDQSARQRRIAAAFTMIPVLVVSSLLAGGFGIAWQTWLRLSDQRRGEEKIRYMAEHDILSGALNRTSFE